MDSTLFLDINRLARHSVGIHWLFHALAAGAGLGILAVLVAWSFVRARSGTFGQGGARPFSGAFCALIGAGLASGLALGIGHFVVRPFPQEVLRHIEVLMRASGTSSLPSIPTSAASAVVAGMLLGGDYLLATLATLTSLLIGFSLVYVGIAYPVDALAGLGLGLVAATACFAAARATIGSGLGALARSSAGFLVGASPSRRQSGLDAGPAAQPVVLTGTGAVRVIDPLPIRPVQLPPKAGLAAPGPAGPVTPATVIPATTRRPIPGSAVTLLPNREQ